MRLLTVLCFVILTFTTIAQGWMPQGARSAGVGNTSVTLVDYFAFHHNPGAIGFLEQGGAAVSYETRYLLRELQSQGFVVAQPLSSGVVSLGGQFYGHETFRTNRFGAGYSMKLSDNFAAGVQMNYLSLRLDPYYGVKHSVTGEVGMLLNMSEETSFGFSVVNLGRARLSEFKDDRFSSIIRIGASHRVVKELLFLVEIEQEVTHATRLRSGLEYQPHERVYVRAGVQGAPMEFSFGTGFVFGQVKLDLATHYNQLLGWTPTVALIVDFAKQSND